MKNTNATVMKMTPAATFAKSCLQVPSLLGWNNPNPAPSLTAGPMILACLQEQAEIAESVATYKGTTCGTLGRVIAGRGWNGVWSDVSFALRALEGAGRIRKLGGYGTDARYELC